MSAVSDLAFPVEGQGPNDLPRSPAWLTIVALGDNDFSSHVAQDEAWTSDESLARDFAAQFETFLTTILARSPGRPVIVIAYADAGVSAHPLMQEVVDRLAAAGEPVSIVRQAKFDRTACDWHPSLADHQMLTATLVRAIDAMITAGQLDPP